MDEAYDAEGFGVATGPVSLPFAMKALSMLGSKTVIARKGQRFVEVADGDA